MPKGKHYTDEERQLLRELVLKHKDTVENKESDSVSASKKKHSWEVITAQFNAISQNSYRNPKQLRKLWENIKFRRKALLASERHSIMTTGGSPPHKMCESDPELVACGINNEIVDTTDSDTVQTVQNGCHSDVQYNINNFLMPIETQEPRQRCSASSAEGRKSTIEVYSEPAANDDTSQPSRKHKPDLADIECTKKKSRVNCICVESNMRIEKEKYSLYLEKEIGDLRKQEQNLKNQLAKFQLAEARKEAEFLEEKRKLELTLLRKQLSHF